MPKSAIPAQNHKSIHPQTSQKFIMSKTEFTLLVSHNLTSPLILTYLNEWHHHLPGALSQTKAKKPRMTPPLPIGYQLQPFPSVYITQIHILLFIPIVPDSVQSLIVSSWNCFHHLLSNLPASPVASYPHCCWSDCLKP